MEQIKDESNTKLSDLNTYITKNLPKKGPQTHLTPSRYFRSTHDLPSHVPCREIREAYHAEFSKTSLSKISEIFSNYLRTLELNKSNICEVYKILLQMDDVSNMSQYEKLTQRNVTLQIYHNTSKKANFTFRYTLNEMKYKYFIELKKIQDVQEKIKPYIDVATILPSGSSFERIPLEKSIDLMYDEEFLDEYSCIIHEVSDDKIHFESGVKFNLKKKYTILFRPVRTFIRYKYEALEMLSNQPEMLEFLFPELNAIKNTKLTRRETNKLELVNSEIAQNAEQLEAVQTIVNGNNQLNAPYIIVGPPGTGKTTTIVEIIMQLRLHHPNSRILVTASSNSACDTIGLKLCSYFQEKSEFHVPEVVRIFSRSIQQNTKFRNICKSLINISNCYSNKHFYPDVSEIRKYNIVIATLSIMGKLVSGDIGEEFFTHVIIDEAASATETETLLGIMGIVKPNRCTVILAGDSKQLGPVVLSKAAAELGLKQSLMDRLLARKCFASAANGSYNHSLQVRLRRNYRSHPEIVRLYNHLYYNNELLTFAKEVDVNQYVGWCHLKNPQFPIIFQAVHGACAKKPNSTSSYNMLEIESVMWYLRRILRDGIPGVKVQQIDVGIITPYKMQCKLIERRLKQKFPKIDVGSVETFQGREKPIIIVSLVRSFKNLGFIGEPRRLNVILSRAKSLLILIGNPITLSHNDDLKFIIEECKKKGTLSRSDKKNKEHNTNKTPTTCSPKSSNNVPYGKIASSTKLSITNDASHTGIVRNKKMSNKNDEEKNDTTDALAEQLENMNLCKSSLYEPS